MNCLHLGLGWSPDEPGGLNRYFRDLFSALRAEDIEAHGVVWGPAADAPANLTAVSSSRAPLPLRLAALLRAARAEGGAAELVDAHFALTAWPALLPPLRRKPLIVHFHGPWAAEARAQGDAHMSSALKRLVERAVYRHAERVVVLSEAFARVVETYGVARERIVVIPPGVDLERFTPGDRIEARRALGLREHARVTVVVRRLVPRMGIDVLMRAWRHEDHGELVIAGDGPERAALEALRVPGVCFLGRVTDAELVSWYRAADATVVPSLALEGFGLVALESLACGTPVVVTDTGGLPEAVRGLDPTLVVPAADGDALVGRLHAPLPTGSECRAHAERFGWAAVARSHRELYESVTGRRLRVVYLDHTAVLAGGEVALANLLPALEVDAHVILAQDGPLSARLRAGGAQVEVLPLAEHARGLSRTAFGLRSFAGVLTTARYAVVLARRLRALRPDVVHTNSLKSALYGGVAARLAGVPCVWHVHDRIALDYLPSGAVRLIRLAARVLPAAVIATSQATANTLPGARRLRVVHPPVPAVAAHRNGRTGPLRVGIVGRLAPWKGQHVFLDAFAQAFPDGGEQAVIVGAALFGSDEERYGRGLEERAATLGIADRTDFRGFRTDIAAELETLDVLVHASVLPEPFGQSVVEGMSAGLAVIASNSGAPAAIIDDGETGLLVTPDEPATLAAALRRLADDPGLRGRLGAAAREAAAAYEPASSARDIAEIYRSIR